MNRVLLLTLIALTPAALLAESATPSLGYAGVPTGLPSDHGGQDCSTCHSTFGPANSDTSGSLTVAVSNYVPGVPQTISITLQHPVATRFGFQMTIREVSDQTLSAGILSPVSTSDPVQVVCDDGSQFGSAPPCNNLRQFAEHKNAPNGMAGLPYTFNVAWAPPETEVGRLIVYVAAVAANNDGTPLGDAVYTSVTTISNAGTCGLNAKPLLQTAVNGASFQPAFAPKSVVAIQGRDFNPPLPPRVAGLGDFVNGAYPTELACISVQVTGPGFPTPVFLPLVSVQQSLILAQMPAFTGTGNVTLQVIANPGAENEIDGDVGTLTSLQPFAPALIIIPNSNNVLADLTGTVTLVADQSVVPSGQTAHAGNTVSIFGTGFGDTNPSLPLGQPGTGVETLVNPISVTIGGVTLDPSAIVYAGLAPNVISGVYRFDLQIPPGTGTGDVQITVSIGGAQTQTPATIPIQ